MSKANHRSTNGSVSAAEPTAPEAERISVDSTITLEGDILSGTRIEYQASVYVGGRRFWIEFVPDLPHTVESGVRWSKDDTGVLRGGTYEEVSKGTSQWFGDAENEAGAKMSLVDLRHLAALLGALVRRIDQDQRNERLARALTAADELGEEFQRLSAGRAR